MKPVSDSLAGSALVLAQMELAVREAREMFKQRCAEEQISDQQIYELQQTAKVAVKRQLQGDDQHANY